VEGRGFNPVGRGSLSSGVLTPEATGFDFSCALNAPSPFGQVRHLANLSLRSIDVGVATLQIPPMPRKLLPPAAYRWAAVAMSGAICLAWAMTRPDPGPLATVEEATHASVRGASAATGTSLYGGDAVTTDKQGTVRLRLGKGKLYLSASSSASLEQRAGLATVTLAEGSATFSLPDPAQFELETPVGVLRGSGRKATQGQVRISKPTEVEVCATHGDLVLDNEGEYYTLAQGKTFRIVIINESDLRAAHDEQAPRASQNPTRKLVFIPVPSTNVT